MTITQLVTQAQAGSRAAFGELYESLAGDLYRMALYTLGSQQDAEDAVADTFAEAWKGIKNLREPEAFRSWMFRILSARCKRQVAQIVTRKKEIDLDSYYETAEEAMPETATRRAELSEALGHTLPGGAADRAALGGGGLYHAGDCEHAGDAAGYGEQQALPFAEKAAAAITRYRWKGGGKVKDERKTERNTEWNGEAEADRDFLREKLKNAGDPALPASLSAAALFERMDAADQQAAAPKKKGGVIWLQWRRWGSIAAVLVLAAGTAFLLQNSSLQNKASQDESSYDAALAPNEAENQDQWNGAATGGPPTDGLMMAPPPNPSTAGGDGSVKKEYATDEIDSDRGLFEEFKSKIVSVGEQPIPDMMDYDAMAAVSSQLFGNDYEQAIAMFYDSGERWEGCKLPQSCAHYFMLDKALYGFFPEESRVVDYSGACATVLNEDEAAMLSAILQIEFTAKTE